jgi:hypothetical protein
MPPARVAPLGSGRRAKIGSMYAVATFLDVDLVEGGQLILYGRRLPSGKTS